MTVDPWIQDHSIMTIDANQLKSTLGELVEPLLGIGDVASAKVALGGQVAPKWPQGLLPHPLASYVCICHHFGQNSCIQIYFHVQVELGEL
jgi:hypothetical protein